MNRVEAYDHMKAGKRVCPAGVAHFLHFEFRGREVWCIDTDLPEWIKSEVWTHVLPMCYKEWQVVQE